MNTDTNKENNYFNISHPTEELIKQNCNFIDQYNEISKWDWSDRGASSYAGSITYRQMPCLKDILAVTNAKSVLEIGFNCGFSALIWLLSGVDYLHSIDMAGSDNGIRTLKKIYEEKFDFLRINSFDLKYSDLNKSFDIVFIDGDHSVNGVINDITKSLLFNPKYIVFDDYFHCHHGADIKIAINQFNNLKLVKEYYPDPGFGLYKVE
jgi:predicted O-methyltransferase YrrM